METKVIERDNWQSYFDVLSRSVEGKRVAIDVAALKIGDQVEVKDRALIGITYDPKDDLVEVAMEDLDHMIRNPVDIQVAFDEKGIEAVQIRDKDNEQQIVRFKDQILLPAPK